MKLVVQKLKLVKGKASSNPKPLEFRVCVSSWLVYLPSLEEKSRGWMKLTYRSRANYEWKPVKQTTQLYFLFALICRCSCSADDANNEFSFTMSCQFICLPILHNIFEDSYRNWEIWVYKTESICCGFSLHYVLYFTSFIFFFINSLSNIWTVIYLSL